MSSSITPAVRRLLEGPLDSFEKLEVVVGLRGAAARTSSVGELARRMQVPADVIERAVDELRRAGMVEVAGGLTRLTAAGDDLAAIDALFALYEEDRVLIVRTLTEVAMDKIRGMAARTFADAFNLRPARKKKDGDRG